jgi:polysaccharide pyruvyl transferase WcaK-like protein
MIYQIAVTGTGNAGDTVLVDATRKAIGYDKDWLTCKLWDEVTDSRVEKFNQGMAVVVGGGGLFIRDTKPNPNTGWRWNCPNRMLAKIKVPIIVYAVGYNRFREQPDFEPYFADSIRALIEHSSFFSMRDSQGKEQLRPYVGDLADKILYQPCPASLSRFLYPEYINREKEKILVFSPAYDRIGIRCKDITEVASQIDKALFEQSKKGWKIIIALHMKKDRQFLQHMKHRFHVQELFGLSAHEVLDFYSKVSITIGMRLHSILIPFGLDGGIIPLISHDKLVLFLEDIHKPKWGVEINAKRLCDKLSFHINNIETDPKIQDALWSITQKNTNMIRKLVR